MAHVSFVAGTIDAPPSGMSSCPASVRERLRHRRHHNEHTTVGDLVFDFLQPTFRVPQDFRLRMSHTPPVNSRSALRVPQGFRRGGNAPGRDHGIGDAGLPDRAADRSPVALPSSAPRQSDGKGLDMTGIFPRKRLYVSRADRFRPVSPPDGGNGEGNHRRKSVFSVHNIAFRLCHEQL